MNKAYEAAIRLLSRREHGTFELFEKLLRKGHDKQEIQDALVDCQQRGFLSDARYTEQLCRVRMNQGVGPLRIQQELQARRVEESLIEQTLAVGQEEWVCRARAVVLKKFRGVKAPTFEQLQKQKRFLAYRGFPNEIIAKAIKEL